MRTTRLLITTIMVLATTTTTHAQTHGDLQPVDQAVTDLDTLATSLRRVEAGLRTDGEQTSLFVLRPAQADADTFSTSRQTPPQWAVNQQPVYYRIGPGFQAKVDRMDYLISTGKRQFEVNIKPPQDGQFFEMIPANTVFDLTPLATMTSTTHAVSAGPDHRIDGRIDLRLNNRVNGKINTAPPADLTTPR